MEITPELFYMAFTHGYSGESGHPVEGLRIVEPHHGDQTGRKVPDPGNLLDDGPQGVGRIALIPRVALQQDLVVL